ncbi:cytochrome d ubiquinol oxidase subunit II [Changpingibacter yushuensis]|uniref:cytochrome d ubiquinol oxidase subunit II n=1 Tax=Changpingibacter yushuensis TaxID=2758440 RepID=UPI0015F66B43|nr:cytochrome d ubiquinol oxidase subunit II [Changpingibacter yushuensis]
MDLSFIQLLWFILIGVLWTGYLTLEGFGFGVGMLLKILPRNEKERRATLNALGPHWDGNEVWVLTAGGATFAAFPGWYATMFSGMYLALVAILLCLIVRIAALEWRKTINTDAWRTFWDWAHTVATWVVSILWGVAFANLVQGMKIEVGSTVDGVFTAIPASEVSTGLTAGQVHVLTGGFFSLLTPFTILGGLVTLSLFLAHGALFIAIKTSGDLSVRAKSVAKKILPVTIVIVAAWAVWAELAYSSNPGVSLVPLVLAAIALVLAYVFVLQGSEVKAFISSFVGIALAVVFIWCAVFPDAMKSSIDPAYSLSLAQASATAPTQTIMTIAAVIFVPIVLGYTIWAYKVFARRIDATEIPDEGVGLHPKKIRVFDAV